MDVSPAEPSPPLWLSHHRPDHHERCLRWRGLLLCRRCVALYSTTLLVLVVAVGVGVAPSPWWLFLLPLPTVVEWWAEHLGRWSYHPGRQVATSVVAGGGLGLGLARYLADPLDPWFWAMVVLYGGACAVPVLWRLLDQPTT